MDNNNNNVYDASSIQILEGLEAVRKRPGMYIGSTGERGLHHLVWEIVDNSIDEALAGHASAITVEILKENIIRVTDNGRGIPTGIHEKTGKSAVETILTTLHAGGKFDGSAYKVSGGLHGVGASVVNALSVWFVAEVHQNNKVYRQKFAYGEAQGGLEIVGETDKTGTVITFLADPKVFTETITYNYETLRARVQQLAFLNRNIMISIIDDREEEKQTINEYHYEGGIEEYVSYLIGTKKPVNQNKIYVEKESDGISVEVCIQYNDSYATNILSFANNINTHEGGMHEDGFKMAIGRVLVKYAKDNNLLKKDEPFTSEDTREGLIAVISVKHPDPQFEGQTKTKLGNPEVRQITSQIVGEGLEKYLLENPKEAKLIIDKCMLAARARIAARKARESTRRQSPLDQLSFATKLADCRTKNAEIAELYIVEGDSAGGSAKQGRESEYQAVLPLRGKVLNVEKARIDKVLSNNEIISLIKAIGTGIGEDLDVSKTRYHKIVIMTDADVDGAHIRTLLLTFFYRYLKPVIEAGYIYFAKPPLYKVSAGKRVDYAYSNEELSEILKTHTSLKPNIQRYKGLGEMNPEQLWETTLDPETRTLLKVTLKDAIEADRVFEMLMGDEVTPRRDFIQENAQYAEIDS